MDGIQTYLFLDLETTGLPKEQNNMTKITEISLVAVKRQHLLDTSFGSSPRVQHKLTLCVNPRKIIDPVATEVTGLCNDLLEFEPTFDKNLINLLNMFIELLTKPVCLIAQNGLNFDFPILRNHLEKFGVSFAEDMACADSFNAFYDIMESQKANRTEAPTLVDTNDLNRKDNDDMEICSNNTLDMKLKNERSPTRFTSVFPVTPKKRKLVRMSIVRRFPWSEGQKPKQKYTLKDIYERLLNRRARNAHHAENDCLLALECAVALSEQFVKWVDENNCLFSQIRPMTIGDRLGMSTIVGLLLVTGMLWGCTNPFIRQGTRGLCKVRAETRFGQAYAEIIFLLGNWRYVVPWLINQGGSLVYLSAVQRVPLSLAVPTANSLAFAFTALTGATLGKEEPLDTGSITGIILIAVGTALCCWDKVD